MTGGDAERFEKVYRDVTLALARVGYDKVVGYLQGGMQTWRAHRLPVAQLKRIFGGVLLCLALYMLYKSLSAWQL